MTALPRQAFRFAVVGVMATMTHVTVAVVMVEAAAVRPIWANLIAFCAALFVSYGGNHRWTFGQVRGHGRSFPRFATVAVAGLVLNQTIMWALAERGGLDYRIALAVVVLVVPALTFMLNKLWVFGRPPRQETAR